MVKVPVRLSRQLILLLTLLTAQLPLPTAEPADRAQQHASQFYGPVLPQDTLAGIAAQMVEQYPDFTLHQIMAGIVQANQDAFPDDRRQPRPASVLRWPGAQLLRGISVESARQMFRHRPGRGPAVQQQAAVSSAAEKSWPLWLRWLFTNLLAIIAFAGISFIWQRRAARQPEDDGALDEETLLDEIAGENIPYRPRAYGGKADATVPAPAGTRSTHSPSHETDMEIQLDIASAYVEMGRWRQARATLAQVLKSGSDAQRQQAQQLLQKIETQNLP